jgi:hypothetical protein
MRYWCAMLTSYVTLSAGESCICSWCCRRSVASVYDYWSSQSFKISNFPIIEHVWGKWCAGIHESASCIRKTNTASQHKVKMTYVGFSSCIGVVWPPLWSSVRVLGYRSGGPSSIPGTTRKKK